MAGRRLRLVPLAPILAPLGLCGFRFLHKGAPVAAGVPKDRALVFTAVLVICAVAINILAVLVISPPLTI